MGRRDRSIPLDRYVAGPSAYNANPALGLSFQPLERPFVVFIFKKRLELLPTSLVVVLCDARVFSASHQTTKQKKGRP